MLPSLASYLVDSDIMVDLTRGSIGAADYLDSLADAWLISMITCLELLAGARTQRETTDIDLVLSGYRAIPPNEDITRRAYYLMKTYAHSHGLHTMDALIAATALEDGLTLATKNRKHFQMISDLRLEVPKY
jgi:predicted nucleic acid-binding protein